jgi:hypothetical protein
MLLVDDMPYRICLNLPSNAIFIESYEYLPKEDNYLMKTILPYLEFLHNFVLNVPTFVEFNLFSAIRIIKEGDVRFQTLFRKCTMACSTNFRKNHLTSVISSPNILLFLSSNVVLDFPISLIFMVSLFSNFYKYYLSVFSRLSVCLFLRR